MRAEHLRVLGVELGGAVAEHLEDVSEELARAATEGRDHARSRFPLRILRRGDEASEDGDDGLVGGGALPRRGIELGGDAQHERATQTRPRGFDVAPASGVHGRGRLVQEPRQVRGAEVLLEHPQRRLAPRHLVRAKLRVQLGEVIGVHRVGSARPAFPGRALPAVWRGCQE